MNIVMCKECGMSYQDSRKPGDYYCPTCQKITKFYKLEAFCGAKPGELYKLE